jgi:CubicO group peptidase (beta-lactamase class C family)
MMNKTEGQKFIDTFVVKTREENLNMLYAQYRVGSEVTGAFQAFPKKTRLNVMSVSKSFTSVGIGIALDEGLVKMDDKVADYFPEYLPAKPQENLLKITLKDMLTMSSGPAKTMFFADDPERYTVKDWAAYFFKQDFAYTPGQHFLYCNFNTYMASRMVEKKAGANLLNYLRYRLFEPLGIGNPDWTLCPQGHAYAANGLYLTIDELGNFGEMLLGMGEYRGKRIVSEAYMKKASTKQMETTECIPSKGPYQGHGYGYFFWMTPIPNTFICNGNYGNYCLVLPKLNTVISCISLQGGNYKRIRDIMVDMAAEL